MNEVICNFGRDFNLNNFFYFILKVRFKVYNLVNLNLFFSGLVFI